MVGIHNNDSIKNFRRCTATETLVGKQNGTVKIPFYSYKPKYRFHI
jgi:hypothetical protein